MRVRVIYKPVSFSTPKYCIQIWRWWWPKWVTVDYWGSRETALQYAAELKHPQIEEVK